MMMMMMMTMRIITRRSKVNGYNIKNNNNRSNRMQSLFLFLLLLLSGTIVLFVPKPLCIIHAFTITTSTTIISAHYNNRHNSIDIQHHLHLQQQQQYPIKQKTMILLRSNNNNHILQRLEFCRRRHRTIIRHATDDDVDHDMNDDDNDNNVAVDDDNNNNKEEEGEWNNNNNNNGNTIGRRREFLVQAGNSGGALLASWIVPEFTNPEPAIAATTDASSASSATTTSSSSPGNNNSRGRTILITGANSGIGFEACKRLATTTTATRGVSNNNNNQDTTIIILACRTMEKAMNAIESITRYAQDNNENDNDNNPSGVLAAARFVPAVCDLSSIRSIQEFVTSGIPKEITHLDVVCYNAGISRNINAKECTRTSDGFELTIGTNHFGHFYLNHLLLPKILATKGSKIVVTASAVHDPASPGGAQGELASLGNLQGLETQGVNCEMIDGQPFNADKAYKDSKLCNVLFTRELQRRLDAAGNSNNIIANSFTPGLIVGTGLFRDQNPLFTKLFNFAATDLLKVGETPSWGGGALAYMINDVTATKGEYYYSAPGVSAKYGDAAFGNLNLFGPTQVSVEAQDNAKAERLWELSEKLLNIKTII